MNWQEHQDYLRAEKRRDNWRVMFVFFGIALFALLFWVTVTWVVCHFIFGFW